MLTTTEPAWLVNLLERLVVEGVRLPPSRWQSQDVSEAEHMGPIELQNETLKWELHETMESAQLCFVPNLPWAEDHFQERVGGEPLNPSPSEAWWPFAQRGNAEHKEGQRFSHTYPERMWPKRAGERYEASSSMAHTLVNRQGIRYYYGDLEDMIDLLANDILTRQAYLPIWFPEDTGARDGQRVPCTLGYHFLFRENMGTITYFMRSCDALRHLKDDAYMAARLMQWVVGKLRENGIDAHPHRLIMHISSLHIFQGDLPMVRNFLLEQEPTYGYGV